LSDEYLASLWDLAGCLGIRDQVRYHGILSTNDALVFQHKASIGLVADLPYKYFLNAIPTKLIECMSLGLPVVCSDLPLYRKVVTETGAGIVIDPTKHEQIAKAIESLVRSPELRRQMGEAGKRAVRERLNWNVEATKLLQLYHQLLGPKDNDRLSQQSRGHNGMLLGKVEER
jgi:glycosyltransferase involved in cell wall biosynthesis